VCGCVCVWCACVFSGVELVGRDCVSCVVVMVYEGVIVCGGLRVVGGVRSTRSFEGEGARVGSGGEVRVMLPFFILPIYRLNFYSSGCASIVLQRELYPVLVRL